ncbi:hypothetical protein BABINDRAFT_159387 [Babjeviella inositovora NRRL Y-12698]|uniref:Transaldolase n=1 Tax=Babjeviella inositovora NRRL Y-12698 TaxID=984486 RepID=A0A1E3QYZ8_9ASCO|nr:uncharacterized protein BABINDRAFT_159387 [Babjeviella inositovora NRRL Y-12698]ODQ82893.1 hypothetical protein BABINDRAFT_159387 [Babjeviella inositovora NRRL Y-12698]
MPNYLEAISKHTVLSIDTMFRETGSQYPPIHFENATSNQAIAYANVERNTDIVPQAVQLALKKLGLGAVPASPLPKQFVNQVINYANAIVGSRMSPEVSGCVMAQVLPSLMHDTQGTVDAALALIEAFQDVGVPKEKVVIKIAVTHESALACRELRDKHGVQCLGTVIHSLSQAVIAAEAGCCIVSPYVDPLEANFDPAALVKYDTLEENYGYNLVKDIHYYYKLHGVTETKQCIAALIDTETVMKLTGVDGMTVPLYTLNLLKDMEMSQAEYDAFQPGLPVDKAGLAAAGVTEKDAGERKQYLGNKALYEADLKDNEIYRQRFDLAINTFMSFDTKMRELVEKVARET